MTHRSIVQRLIHLLAIIAFGWPPAVSGQAAGAEEKATQTADAKGAQSRPRELGTDREIKDLLLVRSTPSRAVVRFGTGPLEVVTLGDRLGRSRAEVTEIETRRLVIEEHFTGRDGAPNRARVVLRDGERGGTRYLDHLDETPPASRRPVTVDPGQQTPNTNGASKKPPGK